MLQSTSLVDLQESKAGPSHQGNAGSLPGNCRRSNFSANAMLSACLLFTAFKQSRHASSLREVGAILCAEQDIHGKHAVMLSTPSSLSETLKHTMIVTITRQQLIQGEYKYLIPGNRLFIAQAL